MSIGGRRVKDGGESEERRGLRTITGSNNEQWVAGRQAGARCQTYLNLPSFCLACPVILACIITVTTCYPTQRLLCSTGNTLTTGYTLLRLFFFLCGCVKFQSNVDNKSHPTSRFATGPDADVAQTVNEMCPYASILTAAIYAEEQCANHQPKGALQCHIGVFEAHAGLFPIAKKSIKCRGIAYCDQQLMRTHSRCRSGNCAIRYIFKAARAVNLKVMQCGIGPCNHDDDTQIILRFFV